MSVQRTIAIITPGDRADEILVAAAERLGLASFTPIGPQLVYAWMDVSAGRPTASSSPDSTRSPTTGATTFS
jgi:hypothetical protein